MNSFLLISFFIFVSQTSCLPPGPKNLNNSLVSTVAPVHEDTVSSTVLTTPLSKSTKKDGDVPPGPASTEIPPTTIITSSTSTDKPTDKPTTPTTAKPSSTDKPTTTPITKPTTPTTTVKPTSSTTQPSTTKTTTSKPVPSSTTEPNVPTTPIPPSRGFDGPSFIGGIVLASGLMAIGFVAFKFYKARTEVNYHTL